MSDPKLMILHLLSAGKITAEQAESLLKALKDDQSASQYKTIKIDPMRTGKLGRAIERAIRSMPDVAVNINEAFEEVGETISSSISSILEDVGMKGGEQSLEVPANPKVEIKHGGGNLALIGVEGNQVKIVGGRRRCKMEGDSVSIISGGGSSTIEIPLCVSSLNVKVGGGNLTIENIKGDLNANSAGGNLTLINISGPNVNGNATGGNVTLREVLAHFMKSRAAGGNVKAELGTITSGQIELNSYGGGVELKLAADSDFEVSLDSFGGEAYSEFELQDVKTDRGSFRGKYGDGEASISISAKGGDARLLNR